PARMRATARASTRAWIRSPTTSRPTASAGKGRSSCGSAIPRPDAPDEGAEPARSPAVVGHGLEHRAVSSELKPPELDALHPRRRLSHALQALERVPLADHSLAHDVAEHDAHEP